MSLALDASAMPAVALALACAVLVAVVARLAHPLRRALVELCGTEERGEFWTRLSLVALFAGGLLLALCALWWTLGGRSATFAFLHESDSVIAKVLVANALPVMEVIANAPRGEADIDLAATGATLRGAIAGALLATGAIAAVFASTVRRQRVGLGPCPPALPGS